MICMILIGLAAGAALQVSDVPALKEHLAVSGLIETQDGAAQRGFAAAGLAHDAESLACVQRKADVVHGVEHSRRGS